VEALAGGLLKLLALPEDQRVKMGQLAKIRVTTEFSIERARERFEKVYREVLKDSL